MVETPDTATASSMTPAIARGRARTQCVRGLPVCSLRESGAKPALAASSRSVHFIITRLLIGHLLRKDVLGNHRVVGLQSRIHFLL